MLLLLCTETQKTWKFIKPVENPNPPPPPNVENLRFLLGTVEKGFQKSIMGEIYVFIVVVKVV